MQFFICKETGTPYAFEDNVICVQQADGTYRFAYTDGSMTPDEYEPDTHIPAKLGPVYTIEGDDRQYRDVIEEAQTIPGKLIKKGELVQFPLSLPGTLVPCSPEESAAASALQQRAGD